MTDAAETVRDVVAPILAARELELYDIEVHSSMVRVIVDRPGGVDLDTLGDVTRAVSRGLDDADPIAHRYTLEVTSPGVERPLRTPEQFIRAVGETVKVKTAVELDGQRRLEGVLLTADQSGITLEAEQGSNYTLGYGDIAKARTVFAWGTPRPSSPGSNRKKRERRS